MPDHKRLLIAIVVASFATVAAVTTTAPAAADRRDEAEACQESIQELKARNLRLRQQAAVDKVEIDRLRQALAALETELEGTRASRIERSRAEPVAPVVRTEPAIESTDLEPAPRRSPPTRPAPPAVGSATDQDALQALYDEGYTLFHQKQYDEAEARFRAFLASSGDSDLADNAHFWVGECRFARGDLRAALEAFTTVVDRYPRGNKVPDAMIKAGKTLESLGDREAARTTYLEVQSRFPGTAAAASAAELLAALE